MNSNSKNSEMNQDHKKLDQLQRFSFTLQSNLIEEIDIIGKSLNMNRSMVVREALSSWISDRVKDQQIPEGDGVGVTSYIYNHHDTRVVSDLMHVQHEKDNLISSTTHVHLSHTKCFEIIILKGKINIIKDLNNSFRSIKGIVSFSEVLIPNNS